MKTKILWIFLAVFVVSSVAWTDEQEQRFQRWKARHNKKYDTPEAEQKAKDAMLQNDGKIEEHNKRFKEGKETFKRGLWKRSDLSFEEKKKLMANAKNFPSNSSNLLQAAPRLKAPIPESLNWTQLGMVHEVEDQRTCGSCYAFATVGVIEGVMLKKGIRTRLSVQQIIDCDTKNFGCGGGDPMVSLKYAKATGLGDASTYKYMNKKGKCQKIEPVSEISSVKKINLKGNEVKLKEIVAQYGPVAVSVNAAESMTNYMEGVYTNPKCPKTPDHAVLLVGYGVDPKFGDYWLVKNSWGDSWGENGYIKMARNKKNLCGIASYVWFAA